MAQVHIIGAGLGGCEAAYRLACEGVSVTLYEMKPLAHSPAHKLDTFAELVCSNSLKAERLNSAAGLLKHEMRTLGSVTMQAADANRVEAGGALAVDREGFSQFITDKIKSNPNIEIKYGEVKELPAEGVVIVATGPLTQGALAEDIRNRCGREYLSFHDAAAPIVSLDSINLDKVFYAARYGRGEDDYINCPFDKEGYERFWQELVNAESVPLKEFEKEHFRVYEGCMPIEVMAKRGADTIRFGPLKPVGLRDPKTGHRPWAVVQLRRENASGTLYNLVGFQTNLKFAEQKRVFSMIPGLENAEFVRYGVMHRNTFLDSPRLLDRFCRLKSDPRIFFAGQITGVEGYIESAASGILAGYNAARLIKQQELLSLPADTMLGALTAYVSDEQVKDFQPMGSNMGILPPLETRVKGKEERYTLLAERAVASLEAYLSKMSIQIKRRKHDEGNC
ncbi:methylenetetrahydrofolate--tRNA-(uracil(54)-C(5))-methyltransferase (FADH(2)-oxidizing) TrmFO [Acetanaerobacterium elongatum]|uniref:Methylenetetrahydrofolate--tRNA-(uracil-5-)-methyltransferase TrmFO n=1 Tax=Acetanaerobacterium elongatum TaxID=258515 RepID=A0A1H0DKZ3_9FIRM|nr:methylenetetrahydrofolate--tRNA-(uracil(54)-C(5))-methyltransferase (FADH(2)-oxidizing) TrmFO [Acetanaerobacterium elongatum]SDN70835.1 methylenetetrahydrofolate--tRNA-(uracil-5-)-methyltransferase [Acetanaerobacterium elongatum]